MEYFKLKNTGYNKSKSADKFNLVKKPRIKTQRNKLNIVNTNKDLQYDNTDIFKMLRTFLESMVFNVRNAEMTKAITPIIPTHTVSTTTPEMQQLKTDIGDLLSVNDDMIIKSPIVGRPPGSKNKMPTKAELEALAKTSARPMLSQIRELSDDDDDEFDSLANTKARPIQGQGLFDTISKVFKTVLPSIKHIVKKPEFQKGVIDISTDFIKNKMKPKEKPKAPTHDEIEAQEFLRMLKAKEITPTEYRELKSGIINKPVSEITKLPSAKSLGEVPIIIEPVIDKNLKNLKGEYHPNKIYSDLLLKKHISPEKYLELTTGKIPNLSQPITHVDSTNVADIPVTQMAATGLRKRKMKARGIGTSPRLLTAGSR